MSKNDSQIVISKKTLTFAVIAVIAIITTVVVVAGAVAMILGGKGLFGGSETEAPPTGNQGSQGILGDLDIDENAGDWTGQPLPDKTPEMPAERRIKIPGYPSITLPKDEETVRVAFLNPEDNPCYFTFELVLKDTGESLYKSKLVPPGKVISEITMSKALSAGEYNATIKITTNSIEDGSPMNGANVETVLIVK